jgi:V/A-type H+-transporting ATPase subunit K
MIPNKGARLAATFLTIITAAVATGLILVTGTIAAAEPAAPAAALSEATSWGLAAAALATGLSALGAAYAVAHVGSAAVGALAEKPELLGRVLILVGLAEGIAIYGLIVPILILNRLG